MKVRPLVAWYDLWIGAYWDRKARKLYVLPLPCIGLVFDFGPAPKRRYRPVPRIAVHLTDGRTIVHYARRRTRRVDGSLVLHDGDDGGFVVAEYAAGTWSSMSTGTRKVSQHREKPNDPAINRLIEMAKIAVERLDMEGHDDIRDHLASALAPWEARNG